MGVPILDHALLTVVLALANIPGVWFFCSYLPRRWDGAPPGDIPAAPGLIEYTEGGPDTRGMT